MNEKKSTFIPVSKKEVTTAIVAGFAKQSIECVEGECRFLY